jgi:diphthamide biosynthesis protein 4
MLSHYHVLGISEDASADAIRQAYKQLVMVCHPDKQGLVSSDTFLALQAAYECLSDDVLRRQYDAQQRQLLNAVGPTTDVDLDDLTCLADGWCDG